jgi:predicted Zn-dependent protease
MKKHRQPIFDDLSYECDVPETSEEFDTMAAETGACVREANKNVIYRSTNAVVRREFVAALVEEYKEELGEELDQITEKDEKGKITGYSVSDAKVVKFIAKTLGVSVKSFQPIMDGIEAKFDPKTRERGGGGSIGKMYLEAAQAAHDDGDIEEVAASLAEIIGEEVDPTVEAVAAALKTRESLRKKEGLLKGLRDA